MKRTRRLSRAALPILAALVLALVGVGSNAVAIDPTGTLTAFGFTGDIEGALRGNQTMSLEVAPGTYTAIETEKEGWELSAIACTDEDSSGDVADRTATFDVAAGDVVKCTFTNTEIEVLPSRIDREMPRPDVQVAPAKVRAAVEAIPFTGFDPAPWIAAAITLLMAGGVTLATAGRMRGPRI